MNDKLYNDLLEYCNYNLEELEEEIKKLISDFKVERYYKESEK